MTNFQDKTASCRIGTYLNKDEPEAIVWFWFKIASYKLPVSGTLIQDEACKKADKEMSKNRLFCGQNTVSGQNVIVLRRTSAETIPKTNNGI